jgi:hypothetical protein
MATVKKTVKKAQLGSLLKAGAKALGKIAGKTSAKAAPVVKKATSAAASPFERDMMSALKSSQRDAMKARFKKLDEEEVIRDLKSGKIPVKGPKGGGLFPMDKKRSGGKVMLKRADGSVSQKGLWDNIRNAAKKNKAAGKPGKKPTAQMLKQEKKIKAASKKK